MIKFKKPHLIIPPRSIPVLFYSAILAVPVIFGGCLILLRWFEITLLISILLAWMAASLTALVPIILFNRKYRQPRDSIKRGIEMMGEGQMYSKLNLEQSAIFSDIAESINFANRQLSDKLQSIIRNTVRLSAVEEELSSCLRPIHPASAREDNIDEHTRKLVYQLKICTSRLKNDLKEFSCGNSESA
jgi:hypothetical protein